MIDYQKIDKIYFYSKDMDMRVGMHKLQILLSCNFRPIEMMHTLFVFCSKNRKTIKIYYEDEYGTWLLINKINFTKFKWPEKNSRDRISSKRSKISFKRPKDYR